MAKGADFADVYVERAAMGGAGSDDRKINTTTVVEKGVGFRAVKEGRTFYAYTASFLPADLYAMAQYVADAAAQGAAKSGAGAIVRLTPAGSAMKFPMVPLPADRSAEQKIELVRGMTERAWSADPRVVQVMQLLRETLRQVNIATSEGKLIDQTLGLTEFISYIFMKDPKGTLQSAIDARGAYAGLSFFTAGNSLETIVDTSVARTKKLLEAVDSPRGVFPVVLGPGAPAVIFHESCGHGMEADLVFKGSNFKDQLGKPTAAKGVTLVDDGTIPSFPGSYAFDDEGTPSERTVLIEDGVQKNYLCDRIWAAKLGLRSTGSGRRQSFRYPPIPLIGGSRPRAALRCARKPPSIRRRPQLLKVGGRESPIRRVGPAGKRHPASTLYPVGASRSFTTRRFVSPRSLVSSSSTGRVWKGGVEGSGNGHRRMVLSDPADATQRPSGENATAHTNPSCPKKACGSPPSTGSDPHGSIVASRGHPRLRWV